MHGQTELSSQMWQLLHRLLGPQSLTHQHHHPELHLEVLLATLTEAAFALQGMITALCTTLKLTLSNKYLTEAAYQTLRDFDLVCSWGSQSVKHKHFCKADEVATMQLSCKIASYSVCIV